MRHVFLCLAATVALQAADFNDVVLAQISSMPSGGGYATTREAHDRLAEAVNLGSDGVRIRAATAVPSYCSGATYLLLLRALGDAQRRGMVRLVSEDWRALLPSPMPDGFGAWGRWNANGPGAAGLIHELGAGKNFTDPSAARPGDFLKIFWTDAVGENERGHLVVFLGFEDPEGIPHVRFWSSNKPAGYGEKSVPLSRVARMLFSRVTAPEAFSRVRSLPPSNPYLAGLLSRVSSFSEACRKTGATSMP